MWISIISRSAKKRLEAVSRVETETFKTETTSLMNPNRVAPYHSLDVLATVAETVSVSDRDPDRAEDSSPLPGDRALRPRKSHSGSRKDSYIAEASQQARCLVDRGTVSERPSTPYVGPATGGSHPQTDIFYPQMKHPQTGAYYPQTSDVHPQTIHPQTSAVQGPATGGSHPQTRTHPQTDTSHPQTSDYTLDHGRRRERTPTLTLVPTQSGLQTATGSAFHMSRVHSYDDVYFALQHVDHDETITDATVDVATNMGYVDVRANDFACTSNPPPYYDHAIHADRDNRGIENQSPQTPQTSSSFRPIQDRGPDDEVHNLMRMPLRSLAPSRQHSRQHSRASSRPVSRTSAVDLNWIGEFVVSVNQEASLRERRDAEERRRDAEERRRLLESDAAERRRDAEERRRLAEVAQARERQLLEQAQAREKQLLEEARQRERTAFDLATAQEQNNLDLMRQMMNERDNLGTKKNE